MKYSNQDINNYYRNRMVELSKKYPDEFLEEFPDGYINEILEVIQFNDNEMEIINFLFENIYYGGYKTGKQKTALVQLCLNCIDNAEKTINFIKGEYEEIDKGLLENFVDINLKRKLININTQINFKYIWYEIYNIENALDNDIYNREKLFDNYFIVSLSRVSFNKDKTKAMAEWGRTFGPLSGSGEYLII